MIWHIFRKDLRLLWPLAAIVTALQFIVVGMICFYDRGNSVMELITLAMILRYATLAGAAALIVMVVHQDGVPGVRQDWLIRPVRRRDLLLAKLLFVLLLVHGPQLVADTLEGLVHGFSALASLGAASSRSLAIFCFLSLPMLVIAAVTSTLAQVLFTMLGVGVLCATAVTMMTALGGDLISGPASGTDWVLRWGWALLVLLLAVVTLPLQYLRRATLRARCLTALAFLLILTIQSLPWRSTFAVQQWLSASSAASAQVVLSFDPVLGVYHPKEGVLLPGVVAINPGDREISAVRQEPFKTLYVPLRAAGLPQDSILWTDRARVRLTADDGAVLYRGVANEYASGMVRSWGPDFMMRRSVGGDAAPADYQPIRIPAAAYASLKDRTLRLEIDYSLTLMRVGASGAFAALNGEGAFAGVGSCTTRLDADGDGVLMNCVKTGKLPCASVTLQHQPSGRHNPETLVCAPSYAPFATRIAPDALMRFGGELPFLDRNGLAKYPVDGPQLVDSQVIIKTYEPEAHFTRQVVIPAIRIGDWLARQQGGSGSRLASLD
ncbi:MAG: hypothetical protein QM718_13485 [Steroidobacteraceae bacterium]